MEAAARVLEFYQSAEEGGELQLHILYIKGKRVSQLGKSIYVNLLTKHRGVSQIGENSLGLCLYNFGTTGLCHICPII